MWEFLRQILLEIITSRKEIQKVNISLAQVQEKLNEQGNLIASLETTIQNERGEVLAGLTELKTIILTNQNNPDLAPIFNDLVALNNRIATATSNAAAIINPEDLVIPTTEEPAESEV